MQHERLLNETYGSQGSQNECLLLPLVHTKYLSYEKKPFPHLRKLSGFRVKNPIHIGNTAV